MRFFIFLHFAVSPLSHQNRTGTYPMNEPAKKAGIKERGNTMNCACGIFSKDVLLWVILIAVVILLFCFS
ncbi:MAG: hypothetical protein IKJ74_02025 [Clostridia bacterium]|nr:hypothetical protein [Clostridia bacterium]